MNIVQKLTLRHIKENKSRSIVTTLGICVSVAMITAVFVAFASFMNFFGETSIVSGGDYHARFSNVSQETLAQMKKDERIAEIGLYEHNETSFLLSDRTSDRAGTGEILIGDETRIKQMLTGKHEGEIPKNDNEVAVERSLLEKNDLSLGIGDKITLSTGNRILTEESGEVSFVYGSYYYPEETFDPIYGEKEYTITMIMDENPATCIQTPVFRGMSEEEKSGNVNCSIKLSEVNYKSRVVLNDMVEKYGIEEYNYNSDYLQTKFAIDQDSFIAMSLIPMAAIILAIIIIASVSLIYNAFSMSLSERVRYLGMLASVGATKKQKRGSVYFEGFLLGIIGIPVGIAAGIIGIGVTLDVVGDKIVSTGMIRGVTESVISMDTIVPVWVVVGVVMMSALTIFISLLIPSRKASTITPIDAIRQTNEIKVKAKKLRTPKIVRAVFGYEGELAHKSLKRNGKKSRVITASIAISIVLFLSCNAFCTMFNQANDMDADIPYQLQVILRYNEKDKFLEELKGLNDIDNVYCVQSSSCYCGKNDSDNRQGFANTDFQDSQYLTMAYRNVFESTQKIFLNTIDDNEFNSLCEKNGIDYRTYYGDTVKGVMLNNLSRKEGGSKVFNDKIIGQKFYMEYAETTPENEKVEIAGLVDFDADNYICSLSPKNTFALYIPLSQYINVYLADTDNEDKVINIGIETPKHEEAAKEVKKILESGYTSTYVADVVDSLQTMNTIVFVLEVFVYGFITLITLITIANIINTISTNILLRRKEFAMLKSVGTTPKGFRKMICLESVFYGLRAVIVAIPLSLLISFAMYKALSVASIAFDINITLYIVTIAAVFLLIGITMIYAVSKLRDDSIVETLKEEIN